MPAVYCPQCAALLLIAPEDHLTGLPHCSRCEGLLPANLPLVPACQVIAHIKAPRLAERARLSAVRSAAVLKP